MKRHTFYCPECKREFSAKYLPGRGDEAIPVMCAHCRAVLEVVRGPNGPVAMKRKA